MGTIAYLRPSGQEPPKGDRSHLTAEERRHLRASLNNLRVAFGGWACLAAAMGVNRHRLEKAACRGGRGSALLAYRASQASGLSMQTILGGQLAEAGACPLCRRKG